jgi:hypothetical protein
MFHITREAVQEAIRQWLGVPHRDVEVDFFPNKGFLVLLPTPSVHDQVLSANTCLDVR